MQKVTLVPSPGTGSAGFIFEPALNKKGEFEVHKDDFVSITLYKRWGAKEKKKEDKKN